MSSVSETCETCLVMVKRLGRSNLKECNNCGHLYQGLKCPCGGREYV